MRHFRCMIRVTHKFSLGHLVADAVAVVHEAGVACQGDAGAQGQEQRQNTVHVGRLDFVSAQLKR